MIFSAWGYNFDSGTSQALLYETAKELKQESRYLTFISYLNGISEATRTLGMVVAGFFSSWLAHLYLSYSDCLLFVGNSLYLGDKRAFYQNEKRRKSDCFANYPDSLSAI